MDKLEILKKKYEHEAAVCGKNEDIRGREVIWRMIKILEEVEKQEE